MGGLIFSVQLGVIGGQWGKVYYWNVIIRGIARTVTLGPKPSQYAREFSADHPRAGIQAGKLSMQCHGSHDGQLGPCRSSRPRSLCNACYNPYARPLSFDNLRSASADGEYEGNCGGLN